MKLFDHIPLSRWLRHEGEDLASVSPAIPRIGLALSSGGARGLAHVGVIQVLEENDIPIAALAGCSMGAYVGSLWAAGLNSRRLEELAAEIKDRKTLFKLLDFEFPPSRGLIRGEKIRAHLERDLGGLNFEELLIPTIIVATDLDALTAHVFNSGSVAAAVHASSAIPGICVPVELNGRHYTDGGASEPLPVTLLQEHFKLDHVIAVNVMPNSEDFELCRDKTFGRCRSRRSRPMFRLMRRALRRVNLMEDGNVIDTFRRALMSAQLRLIVKECARADIIIQPRCEQSSWHDFENFDRYIRAGREAAEEALPAIFSLLGRDVELTPRAGHLTAEPSKIQCA